MSERVDLFACKALLGQFPSATRDRLLSLLPQEEKKALDEIPLQAPISRDLLHWDLLDHTHPSWLAPYLRSHSGNDFPFFLAALGKEQGKKLMDLLGIQNELPLLSKMGKKWLRELMSNQLTEGQEVLPPPFLPARPLNVLLILPDSLLENLIHCLGLHDLAFAMRQVISTTTLKQIYSFLPEKEGAYLQKLLLHRETIPLDPSFLLKWDGNKESLRKKVFELGLQRLSHALFSYHPSVKWLLAHRLEMSKGTQLFKYTEAPTHVRAEAILSDQIEKIVTFLTQKESA